MGRFCSSILRHKIKKCKVSGYNDLATSSAKVLHSDELILMYKKLKRFPVDRWAARTARY